MNNTQPEAIQTEPADTFAGSATYCPEDNKLRLYVGRVPRDEYLKLRAEGWVALPKQRENGGGDFAATWTPQRRDTALSYAGFIGDEDKGPAERAAERAERFSGYRDKRTDEATTRADQFDAGPSAHGFQSAARAERAATRHDRIAGRAVDAWEKAEYWTERTKGVIAHALHVSSPSVRMGRIKELEADLRRYDGTGSAWESHTRNRLAYENQMLEAQGGRAGVVEMVPGGIWRGGVIAKINKSNTSGRVVSVCVIVPAVTGWHYQVTNEPGTPFALMQCMTERARPDCYQAPTDESRVKLAEFIAAKKSAALARKETVAPCPLINPTDADAERLQALWNAQAMAERVEAYQRLGYSWEVTDCAPVSVLRITQAEYSAASKGSYARACTREVFAGGVECAVNYNAAEKMRAKYGRAVCQLRRTSGGQYNASRVIILTDKPQKPLPAAVWQAIASPQPATSITEQTGDWQGKLAAAEKRAAAYEAQTVNA